MDYKGRTRLQVMTLIDHLLAGKLVDEVTLTRACDSHDENQAGIVFCIVGRHDDFYYFSTCQCKESQVI